MNGRIYDPGLGRFLQADPLIQDLGNPQSLNRYSYVFNNPLAYTDPTGYSAFSKYLRPILAIGAAYFTGGWATSLYAAGNTAAALAVSIGGGALTGAIANGSGKGALIGAFTGAAAFGVGSSIAGGGSNGVSNSMARAGAEALAGGLQSQVNNGSFGAGFMSGFSVEYKLSTGLLSSGINRSSIETDSGSSAGSESSSVDFDRAKQALVERGLLPSDVASDSTLLMDKTKRAALAPVGLNPENLTLFDFKYVGTWAEAESLVSSGNWDHVDGSYSNGQMKIYMSATRSSASRWLSKTASIGLGRPVSLTGSQNLVETIHHEYLHFSGVRSHLTHPLQWGIRVRNDLGGWINEF